MRFEAPVGHMLYAAPRNARFFLEVDSKRLYVREVGRDLGSGKRKFTAILPGKAPRAPSMLRASTASPTRSGGAPGLNRYATEGARSVSPTKKGSLRGSR